MKNSWTNVLPSEGARETKHFFFVCGNLCACYSLHTCDNTECQKNTPVPTHKYQDICKNTYKWCYKVNLHKWISIVTMKQPFVVPNSKILDGLLVIIWMEEIAKCNMAT